MKKEEKRLETLLEKQNHRSSREMSQQGKTMEEILPYLISGESDDLSFKNKK